MAPSPARTGGARTSRAARVRAVRIVSVPTPDELGIDQTRPGFLQPLVRRYSDLPCAECPALCCTFEICLNVVDLARLVVLLGVDPHRIVRLDPEFDANLTTQVVIEGRPVQMMLQHQESTALGRTACQFLASPGGEPRCGVYGARPGICRAYPFRYVTDAGTEFSAGAPAACPRAWVLTEEARQGIEGEIVAWRNQRIFADRVVRAWNRTRGQENAHAFFRYAVERGARHLKLDSRWVLDAPRRGLGAPLW